MNMADNTEQIKQTLHKDVADAVKDVAAAICEDMRQRLTTAGHVDTGALLESIRYETETDGSTVTAYIYADAENPENGAKYAEFIEMGTGAAHGRAGGREGTWRYKDRHGNWHTTDGMDADPFIEPSVAAHLPELGDRLKQVIYDIAKYHGRGTAE